MLCIAIFARAGRIARRHVRGSSFPVRRKYNNTGNQKRQATV